MTFDEWWEGMFFGCPLFHDAGSSSVARHAYAAGHAAGIEAAAKHIEGVANCDCEEFCECYGKSTILKVAVAIRALPVPASPTVSG